MKKTRNTKDEKGITLIILVVTIVVILILAGITVDIAFSDNGMIKSALGIQEKINREIENDESRMNKLQGEITNGSISSGGGLIPDMNRIGGGGSEGEETTPPSAPQVKIQGTEGETGCYRSEVEVIVTANDRSDKLTYTIEGTGIEQGSISTETPIANGQSIKVTGDGAYTITIYEYNRNGQKSEGKTVQIVKDTVAPNGSLAVTKKAETTITIQLVADDPEPSSGLASSNPYTFYYKEEGTDTWVEAGKGSTSTYTYEGLKETARYSLKAEITDKAGNQGTSNEVLDVPTEGNVVLKEITDWTKPNIHKDETTSFTIETTKPVKVTNETNMQLEPNTTGSHVTIQAIDPDENGYATKFTVTVTGGDGNGTEVVVIPKGTLEDQKGNTLETIRKEGVTVDNTKPGIGTITKPTEEEIIKKGDTSTEIILKPTEQPVTIDPDKFKPVDKDGNEITDPTTKVTVTQDDDGNIHITITGGDQEGKINIELQPGAITDEAGNENNDITIDTNITVDNTKPSIQKTDVSREDIIKQADQVIITLTPSEDITLDTSKIILTGDGSTGATKQVSQNPDGTITINLTGGTGTGTIGIELQLGALTDKAGNSNDTITLDTIAQIDNSAPTISAQVTATTSNSITVAVTATDNGPAGLATENTYTYHITGEGVDKTIPTTQATYTFQDLPQGKDYKITITAKDSKDNTATTTLTATTGTVPEGQGNITLSSVTWNQDGTPEKEGTAKITVTNNKPAYTMQYQIVRRRNAEDRGRMDRGRRRSNRSRWITS